METADSVRACVREGDFMASIDLQDAYFQVPVHPSSRKFLRIVSLVTAPQVFTRVFKIVSICAHARGIRLLRYLNDWLILAETAAQCADHLQLVLSFVQELEVVVNVDKSDFTPRQRVVYLGMTLNSSLMKAFPSENRVSSLVTQVQIALGPSPPTAKLCQSILGHMASIERLVPHSRRRMRPLQWLFKKQWSPQEGDPNSKILLSQEVRESLEWWMVPSQLQGGISLSPRTPEILLFTDASKEGLGAHLTEEEVSGLWLEGERAAHINVLELKAVFLSLQHFLSQLQGKTVGLISDNSTVVAYLNKQGVTISLDLCRLAVQIQELAEKMDITLKARYIPGKKNVWVDHLSRRGQIINTEWSLHQEVADGLIKRWGSPSIDLFATAWNRKLPVFFSPLPDPQAAGEDALLQDWKNLDAYAFPPFPLLQKTLQKIRYSQNLRVTLVAPWWPKAPWFPEVLDLRVGGPG
ncbi:uncharacterized protein LOC135196517 [Macrobrachium nipponense]|uniref:uncharacterized protein LOC135196517 n=1 Tax=Macrobrachium nipponense TaxID=159736 RepID=UPI0030C8C8D5